MKAQHHLVADSFYAILSFVEQRRISAEELDKEGLPRFAYEARIRTFNDYDWDSIDPDEVAKKSRLMQLSKDVACYSFLVARDEDQLLPLKPVRVSPLPINNTLI